MLFINMLFQDLLKEKKRIFKNKYNTDMIIK